MLYHTILYHAILHHTIACCTIRYCTNNTVPSCACCTLLYQIILYHTILCCAISYCAIFILYCAVPQHTILHYTVEALDDDDAGALIGDDIDLRPCRSGTAKHTYK